MLSTVGGLANDAIWVFGSFVLITADPTNTQTPLTQMPVIQHLVPLPQALGDAGLTAAVIWSVLPRDLGRRTEQQSPEPDARARPGIRSGRP